MPTIKDGTGGKTFNALMDEALRVKLKCLPAASGLQPYADAFADAELIKTCMCLLENDLNVSRTAKKLYMHRNTLIYRIAKLKRLTGLDARVFADAVTFMILYRCYCGRGADNEQ